MRVAGKTNKLARLAFLKRSKYFIPLLLVALLAFVGCAPQLEVTLQSPGNGSTVSSLQPILAWGCNEPDARYRLQVASDSGFQNLIIDVSDLSGPSYTIPSNKLTDSQSYYWRVRASKAGQTSSWSTLWSFQTPTGPGAISVQATLDGSPWSGASTYASYTIHGPDGQSSYSSVPESFSNMPAGTYTLTYNSGGLEGATLSSISPSPTQTLSPGGTITFTMNFYSQPAGTVMVTATLDGTPWSGHVRCSIEGPIEDSSYSVPDSFSSLPLGTYTVSYSSGGPSGAMLASITPSPTQTLSSGGAITFTLNFQSQATGTVVVQATLDGSPWSGNVRYSLSGPTTDSGYSVSETFGGLPPGTYTLSYRSGGPEGATLGSITPSTRQTLSADRTITFTLNFHSQESGTVMVQATLDGSPWQTAIGSGTISYTLHGPVTDSSHSMPDTFSDLPPGTYTLSYTDGGPTGATLVAISPAPRQTLAPGGVITFTLEFQTQAKGTVLVQATLNGEPWSGDVIYYLAGPYMDTGSYVPDSFTSCPTGSYSVDYKSGGPDSSVLDGITPSSQQDLSPGGTITFTLNFVGILLE
jgi:uncharacterized protein (DUF2141 family)